MRLSIKVDGELVRKGLEDLQAEIPQIGRRQIYNMTLRILKRMRPYPPKRPGQLYVRTYRLQKSWKIEKLEKGYAVLNEVRSLKYRKLYGKYVVGNAYGTKQAWMHKKRWLVLRDVVDEEVKALPKPIAAEIVMVARRKGFEAKQTNG